MMKCQICAQYGISTLSFTLVVSNTLYFSHSCFNTNHETLLPLVCHRIPSCIKSDSYCFTGFLCCNLFFHRQNHAPVYPKHGFALGNFYGCPSRGGSKSRFPEIVWIRRTLIYGKIFEIEIFVLKYILEHSESNAMLRSFFQSLQIVYKSLIVSVQFRQGKFLPPHHGLRVESRGL